MASTRGHGSYPPFVLTPQQQNLLFRALTSNQPAGGNDNTELSLSPTLLTGSPADSQKAKAADGVKDAQESPFLDYDYDFGPDSSFDFDFSGDGHAKMIGDLPSTTGLESESKASSPDNESSEKRGHPDEEDDDDLDEGGGKRRESEGKTSKKPGRKPLTNEPTTVCWHPSTTRTLYQVVGF
jgi:AP-1-like factor